MDENRTRASGFAIVTALALTLVACGGDVESPPVPAPSPTPSPSPQIEVQEISLELSDLIDAGTLAVDPDGNIFFANVAAGEVQVFSPDGALVTSWGGKGEAEGRFSFFDKSEPDVNVGGLDIDADGNVYVADAWNSRVQKFDGQGTFLLSWGEPGTMKGEFIRPIDVAVADDGTVFVIDDRGSARIQQFSPEGEFLQAFGAGPVVNPGGMDFGPDGNLYVANYGGENTLKFSPEGKLLASWNVGDRSEPVDAAVAPDGTVYIADSFHDRLYAYDAEGNELFFISEVGGSSLEELASVAVDAESDIYIVDEGPDAILHVTVNA
ncbi:MAG: NHL repeat-containing protein [Actinomycetota bacterium]